MVEDIKNKVLAILSSKMHMRLATVTPEGNPLIRTAGYINDDAFVYTMAHEGSRRIRDIVHNPRVAYTVDDDSHNISTMRVVNMEGIATIVEDEQLADSHAAKFLEKYTMFKNMPRDPDMLCVKIIPQKASLLEHTIGFVHIEKVIY